MSRIGDPSSKYGYEPKRFELEVARLRAEAESRRGWIKNSMRATLITWPDRTEETFTTMIECMKQLKEELEI